MDVAELSPSPAPLDEKRLARLLSAVLAEPRLHARFLNTLSLMEHIGSRKIMASRAGGALAAESLKHLAEETRHAFFFKRAGEGIAGSALSYEDGDLLAGPEARGYMGRLDGFIAERVQGAAAYLYMSLVIELRAVAFYRFYQEALKKAGTGPNLTSVLAEEKHHLAEMEEMLAGMGEQVSVRLPEFLAFEAGRFETLLGALERAAGV
jgi:hypothetical protein